MIKTTGLRLVGAVIFSYATGVVGGINLSILLPNPDYNTSWSNVIMSLFFAIVVPAIIIEKHE